MALRDSGWPRVALNGSGWLCMVLDGSGWIWMALQESVWLWVALDGSGWLCVPVISGLPCGAGWLAGWLGAGGSGLGAGSHLILDASCDVLPVCPPTRQTMR